MAGAWPSRVAYFVSNHGYGHALRSARLISELTRHSEVAVFSTLEKDFFQREIAAPFDYVELELDCGCVQSGALDVDIAATYQRYATIESERAQRIETCCDRLVSEHSQFVIGDIPPLAFAAAHRLGLPSLGISNFTWAEIYADYVPQEPRFEALLAAIRRDYAFADHYARLYPGLPTHPFMQCTDVGLLCRTAARERKWVADSAGLNAAKKWCLIYFGAFGVEEVNWHRLAHYKDWEFIGLYPLPGAPANYWVLTTSDSPVQHSDIIANCDMVLGKLGYGLVSECLYWGRPVAYPPRRQFAEHVAIEHAVSAHGIGFPLPVEDLMSCRLERAFTWAESASATCYRRRAAPEILDLVSAIWTGSQEPGVAQ